MIRSSGLCTCGHVVLIHTTIAGLFTGPCLHTACKNQKGAGCQHFEPATIELPDPLFRLGKDHRGGEFIQCGICRMKSYNLLDIEHGYCGNCHIFFDTLNRGP